MSIFLSGNSRGKNHGKRVERPGKRVEGNTRAESTWLKYGNVNYFLFKRTNREKKCKNHSKIFPGQKYIICNHEHPGMHAAICVYVYIYIDSIITSRFALEFCFTVTMQKLLKNLKKHSKHRLSRAKMCFLPCCSHTLVNMMMT